MRRYAMAVAPDIDWDAARLDYESDALTTIGICRKYGIGHDVLAVHARRAKWHGEHRSGGMDRSILIRQLFGVLEKQIKHLEGVDMTTTGEKEVAVLGKLAATLEKLIEIDGKATTKKPGAAQTKEMQDLRDKLVKRIEAFKQLQSRS
ncbi:MAG: hypothetical protein ACYC0C_15925 [Devosia sp.]